MLRGAAPMVQQQASFPLPPSPSVPVDSGFREGTHPRVNEGVLPRPPELEWRWEGARGRQSWIDGGRVPEAAIAGSTVGGCPGPPGLPKRFQDVT